MTVSTSTKSKQTTYVLVELSEKFCRREDKTDRYRCVEKGNNINIGCVDGVGAMGRSFVVFNRVGSFATLTKGRDTE